MDKMKEVIHYFALILSIAAIFHTLIQFSDDWLFKTFFGAGAVFAALFTQFIRALAAAYRKRGNNWDGVKAFGLWIIVIIDIIALEAISAFGIVVTQVDLTEQVYIQQGDSRTGINDDLKAIRQAITDKQSQQNEEFKNRGRGSKYDRLQAEIDDLKSDKAELEAKLETAQTVSKTIKKSVFTVLNEVTTIPANWFKIVMSCALLMSIFIAPLLTPWKLQIDDEKDMSEVTNKPPTPPAELPQPPTIPLTKVSEVISEGLAKPITTMKFLSDREKMREFVMALYKVEDINQLKGFYDVYSEVRPMGITYRDCDRYLKKLNEIGAVETVSGRNSRGIWSLDEILEHMERVG